MGGTHTWGMVTQTSCARFSLSPLPKFHIPFALCSLCKRSGICFELPIQMIRNAALLSIVLLKTHAIWNFGNEKPKGRGEWHGIYLMKAKYINIYMCVYIYAHIFSSSQNKLISFMPLGCCIFYLMIKENLGIFRWWYIFFNLLHMISDLSKNWSVL